jgi:hypothetical protein
MADTTWDTFIGGTVSVALPQFDSQSGGYNWKATGEYVFVQQEPRIAGENTLPTGGFPFAVAPNDSIAATIAGGFTGGFTNDDPTVNGFDNLAISISSTVSHDDDRYLWPFTFLPPIFATDQLIGA